MYHVLKQDLDRLAAGYMSIHLGMFGVSFGAFVSCGITYATAQLQEPLATRFLVLSFVFGVLSLYFGAMALRDYFRARRDIQRIKEETTTERIVVVAKQS